MKKTNGQRDKIATLRVGPRDSPESRDTKIYIYKFIEFIETLQRFTTQLGDCAERQQDGRQEITLAKVPYCEARLETKD